MDLSIRKKFFMIIAMDYKVFVSVFNGAKEKPLKIQGLFLKK